MSGFWSSETLSTRLPDLISPYRPARVNNSAYEMSLGYEAYVTRSDHGHTVTQLKQDASHIVNIPPGQFALLLTEETIIVPPEAIGFISIKFSLKLRGLVNISGFHVDPGYEGRLLFSVFNAGSQTIAIAPGAPTFLLWYAGLDAPTTDVYRGTRKGRQEIFADEIMNVHGTPFNPSEVAEKLIDVDRRVQAIEDTAQQRRDRRAHLLMSVVSGLIVLAISVGITIAINAWSGS